MMPFTPHRDSRHTPRPSVPARAFTLTEMLVVIGMIVLIIGIAAPMITRAWRAGDRTRTAADLAAIATALEAYRQDHGSYPQVPSQPPAAGVPMDFNGARMLCRALIAPGSETGGGALFIPDGKGADAIPPNPALPGPGFRTRKSPGPDGLLNTADDIVQGTVYGPYLKPESFKLGDPSGKNRTEPAFLAILDRYNRPFLYYPANGKPNIRLARSYAWDRTGAERPLYNALDNQAAFAPRQGFARMLGDTNADGRIDATASPPEEPAYEGPYLLWSSGPDEVFGPPAGMPVNTTANIRKAVEKSDDVTNFRN